MGGESGGGGQVRRTAAARRRSVDRAGGALARRGRTAATRHRLGQHFDTGFTIADEVEYFVAGGLSLFDAISTGTTAVARYLGRDDLGMVKPGHAAELLLVERDPLVDVAAVRHLAAVFSNGFVFDREELDRLLAWREATAEATVELPESELGPMANKTWWAR